MAITGLLAARFHLSILVQNLATMLGLGLGIDYALLMVSRFREALCAGCDGPAAASIAARQAGHTLSISASTVAIGFLALLTVPISEIRSIGVAGILVAGMCVLLANTLVPAVLALLGHRIEAGRLPFRPRLDAQWSERTGKRWRRWGMVIVAHPWRALFLAGAPMLLLAWQATRLDTSLPRGNWLPQAAESVQALNTLSQMGRNGVVESLRIVVELPESIAAYRRGVECDRSSLQAARQRSPQRARHLNHDACGRQPLCAGRPLRAILAEHFSAATDAPR